MHFFSHFKWEKEVLRLVIANIVGSIFSLAVTSLLAIKYSLYGALVALSIYQSLAFWRPYYYVIKLIGLDFHICLEK